MTLSEFLSRSINSDITSDEAMKLNVDLASKTVADIPSAGRSQVLDYLIVSLNNDSVSPELAPRLDLLVSDLQNIEK